MTPKIQRHCCRRWRHTECHSDAATTNGAVIIWQAGRCSQMSGAMVWWQTHISKLFDTYCKIQFFFIAATLRFLYPWYRFLCIQYRYVCASFRYHCIFNTVTYVLITYPNKYLLQSGVYLIHSHMYMLLFINVYNKKANCSDQNQVCICH